MKLRCYQAKAVQAIIDKFDSGEQTTLAVLPTGAGKTIVAGFVIKHYLAKGRAMILAHRDELIRQAYKKVYAITGILPAVEKADEISDEDCAYGKPPLVISSVQTHNAGGDESRRMQKFDADEFAFLWVDEGHHAIAASYRRCIEYYRSNPKLKVLLVTATPDRADEIGLIEVCPSVAFVYELPDIIADGYLVPIRQRRVRIEGLDFSKVSTTAGDLDAGELEAAMMMEKPLHGVAHATIEIACGLEVGALEALRDNPNRAARLKEMLAGRQPRKTLIFTVTVEHAKRMAEIIERWLPQSAKSVDGKTPEKDRRQLFKDYAAGEFQFLVNCMIATEGFDEPGIELVVVARPTKSRPLYSQMCGRGTRPLESIAHELGELDDAAARRACIKSSAKPFLEILDFVGNSGRHKLITSADILGTKQDDAVIARAAELAEDESVDMTEALEQAQAEVELSQDADRLISELEAEELHERDLQIVAAAAQKRLNIVGTGVYQSNYVSAFDRNDVAPPVAGNPNMASEKQVAFLQKLGVKPETAARYSKRQASAVIENLKSTRCSNPQRWRLKQMGFPEAEIMAMNFDAASAAIEAGRAAA